MDEVENIEGRAGAGVTVLIVTYNSAAHIASCVSTVPAHVRVVVLDNASTDATLDVLMATGRQITLIRSDENLGFAAGVNRAAAAATTPLLLLLNPDARLRGTTISALAEAMDAAPDLAIAGAVSRDAAGAFRRTSGFRAATCRSLLLAALGLRALFPSSSLFDPQSVERAFASAGPGPFAVDVVPGACMMIRRSAWRRLGGFDPRFFMYSEDADLCARARASGLGVALIPAAEFTHDEGASAHSRAGMFCQLFAGEITWQRLHGRPVTARCAPALLKLHVLVRRLAAAIIPGRIATDWGEVWAQRHVWARGYQAAASPASVSGGRIT